jgi:nitroimidazol reductase NimA-like FMN-containing flavoprotein (pyridoxamine 5'-phosphate oxidase superfamily)
MRVVDSRTGIEVIGRDECFGLLRADVVGRIGFAVHGAPTVLPVNYTMDGENVVFRTAPGSKLSAVGRAPVCFEVDAFDREAHTGWSVVLHGRLEEVTVHQPAELGRMQATGLSPWLPPGRDHWLRIVPGWVSGRRIRGDEVRR